MLGRGFILAVFLVLAGSSLAATNWTNGAGGGDWGDPGNWSSGLPDDANETTIQSDSAMVWPVLDGGVGACKTLKIANSSGTVGQLTVSGSAVLTTSGDLRISRTSPGGQVGILYVDGDSTSIICGDDVEVGRWGDGTIDMSGGYLSTAGVGNLRLAYHTGSVGTIYLRGGTIEVGTGGVRVGKNETDIGTALIDIYAGTLVIAGDAVRDVNDLATRLPPVIIAYGGSGTVSIVYAGGETVVTAIESGVNVPPVVDAGGDVSIILPDDTVKLGGYASDDGRGDPNGFLDITWSVKSQPGGSAVIISNSKARDPNATFDTPGEYVLLLTASDGLDDANDMMVVTVYPEWYVPPRLKSYFTTRLNNAGAIVNEQMFIDVGATQLNGANMTEGENLNGPSALRIPGWIAPANRADPSAVYYLYFAHHRGDYLRLAWAAEIEGPWHLYNVGTGVPLDGRGVLSLASNDEIDIGNGITVRNHIASPDVFADDDNERIIMYFHSPTNYDGSSVGQSSFVATSPYGLDFNGMIEPVILGGSYFHVFEYGGDMYAFDNGGDVFMAPDADDPWTPPVGFDFSDDLWAKSGNDPLGDDLDEAGFDGSLRHTAIRLDGDTLEVFYSRKYDDRPERILMSTIDLSVGDHELWDSTYPPEEILAAQPGWEGGQFPPIPSEGGDAPENVNQLRDPYVFEDVDGTAYLFYAGSGEDAIGLARLDRVLAGDFEPDGDVDEDDLDVLIGQWLQETGYLAADLDESGGVGGSDFGVFAEGWKKEVP